MSQSINDPITGLFVVYTQDRQNLILRRASPGPGPFYAVSSDHRELVPGAKIQAARLFQAQPTDFETTYGGDRHKFDRTGRVHLTFLVAKQPLTLDPTSTDYQIIDRAQPLPADFSDDVDHDLFLYMLDLAEKSAGGPVSIQLPQPSPKKPPQYSPKKPSKTNTGGTGGTGGAGGSGAGKTPPPPKPTPIGRVAVLVYDLGGERFLVVKGSGGGGGADRYALPRVDNVMVSDPAEDVLAKALQKQVRALPVAPWQTQEYDDRFLKTLGVQAVFIYAYATVDDDKQLLGGRAGLSFLSDDPDLWQSAQVQVEGNNAVASDLLAVVSIMAEHILGGGGGGAGGDGGSGSSLDSPIVIEDEAGLYAPLTVPGGDAERDKMAQDARGLSVLKISDLWTGRAEPWMAMEVVPFANEDELQVMLFSALAAALAQLCKRMNDTELRARIYRMAYGWPPEMEPSDVGFLMAEGLPVELSTAPLSKSAPGFDVPLDVMKRLTQQLMIEYNPLRETRIVRDLQELRRATQLTSTAAGSLGSFLARLSQQLQVPLLLMHNYPEDGQRIAGCLFRPDHHGRRHIRSLDAVEAFRLRIHTAAVGLVLQNPQQSVGWASAPSP